MANDILTVLQADSTITITVSSLTNNSARQSSMLTNSGNYPAAKIYGKMRSGTVAPTASTIYEVFLIQSNGTRRSDGAGASDAAITILNARRLGSFELTAATSTDFFQEFDTAFVTKALGPEWGIAVRNLSGQTTDTTAGNHVFTFQYYNPQVQ